VPEITWLELPYCCCNHRGDQVQITLKSVALKREQYIQRLNWNTSMSFTVKLYSPVKTWLPSMPVSFT
jgi:hypothetical protein